MCLQLENKEINAKIAKEDIIVYKVIKQLVTGDYETPYQYYPIEIGETYQSKLIKKNGVVEIGLHSFKTLEGAKSEKNWSDRFGFIRNNIVVECVIPKGSEYYKGRFGIWNNISYASNKLTYTNKIID